MIFAAISIDPVLVIGIAGVLALIGLIVFFWDPIVVAAKSFRSTDAPIQTAETATRATIPMSEFSGPVRAQPAYPAADPRTRRIEAFGHVYDLQSVLTKDCRQPPPMVAEHVQAAAKMLLPEIPATEPTA